MLSGLSGFLIGAICHPVWQVPVETAQVLAGVVQYPADNPFYIYHLKAWSLLCQFSALLLKAGLPEAAVSALLSGLFGMLAFQALCFAAFAVSRRVFLALAAPFFIYSTNLLGFGVSYPILWFKNVDSFGGFGLFGAVLVIGLFGSAQFRAGAFLLGLLPCIHVAYGFCLFASAGVMAILNRHLLRRMIRRQAVPFFCSGLAVSILSFFAQRALLPDFPPADPAAAREILVAFVRNLDYHRQPFDYLHRGELAAVFSVIAAAAFLFRTGRRDSRRALPFFLLVTFVLSNLAAGLSHLDPAQVPSFLLALMPGRFINLNNILLAPLLLGLLGGSKKPLAPILLLLFTSGALLLALLELKTCIFTSPDPWRLWILGAGTLAAGAALLAGQAVPPRLERIGDVLRPAPILLIALFSVYTLTITAPGVSARYARVFGQSERPVYHEASRQPGLLLVSSDIHLVQLLTRRAILLEPDAVDGLAYAPESAQLLSVILQDIYGVNLFQKLPPGVTVTGGTPKIYKNLWERRTVADWQKIRARFGVTGILCTSKLQLRLPVIARDEELTFYEIPASP